MNDETREKIESLKRHNMFYIFSLRTTKKQVTGFSFKLVRYDIVERTFRSTVIFEQVYKPKFFQRKENKLKNGINHKFFKKNKLYSENTLKNNAELIYNVVNKPTSIVFSSTIDEVALKFIKKNLPNLNLENIRMVSDESLQIKNPGKEFETVSDVFYDVQIFKNFIDKNL